MAMSDVFGPVNGYKEYEYKICVRHHNVDGKLKFVERIVSDAVGVIYQERKRVDAIYKDNSPVRRFEEWLIGERDNCIQDGNDIGNDSSNHNV